MTPFTRRKNE